MYTLMVHILRFTGITIDDVLTSSIGLPAQQLPEEKKPRFPDTFTTFEQWTRSVGRGSDEKCINCGATIADIPMFIPIYVNEGVMRIRGPTCSLKCSREGIKKIAVTINDEWVYTALLDRIEPEVPKSALGPDDAAKK